MLKAVSLGMVASNISAIIDVSRIHTNERLGVRGSLIFENHSAEMPSILAYVDGKKVHEHVLRKHKGQNYCVSALVIDFIELALYF